MTRRYKLRGSRDMAALEGEPVWGNGCEVRNCLMPSTGYFLRCPDGVCREFCADHGGGLRVTPVQTAGVGTRIECAAVLYEGLVYWMPRPARHHDIAHRMHGLGLPPRAGREQGFLTDTGRYVRRAPARAIAEGAGQLLPRAGRLVELYSEDVW